MKKLFFNLYFWPLFLIVTLVNFLLLPVTILAQLVFFDRTFAAGIRRAIRFYGWFLVRIVPFLKPVSIIDRSNGLPGPVIFTPNHSSSIDPYLFGAIDTENCFVTSWPFKIPVYSLFMKLAGYINSEDGWDTLKREGIKRLESGSSLTIWPEGHRSRDQSLLRFRNGAFRLAVETGYPILPICILGAYNILPPGSRFLNPGQVQIILLPPIYPPEIDDQNSAISILKKETKTAISDELVKHLERSSSAIPSSEPKKANPKNHHANQYPLT